MLPAAGSTSGLNAPSTLAPSRGGLVTVGLSDCYGCPLTGPLAPQGCSRNGLPVASFTGDPYETSRKTKNQPQEQAHRAAEGGSGAGNASGLVYSQTSATPKSTCHTRKHIDPVAMRLSRLKRGTLTAARLLQEQCIEGGFRGRVAMLTLTYADKDGWKPRHLPDLLDQVRKWLKRRGQVMRYVWVAEMQQRGAIHYHVLLWLPRGLSLPKPDKQGWWRHGFTKIEWARNAVGYVAKYTSKGTGSAPYPKSARIHGCGGLRGGKLDEARYWRRPGWLREQTSSGQALSRMVGGGWLDRETGEVFKSPWKVLFIEGGVWIELRGEEGQTDADLRLLDPTLMQHSEAGPL